MRSGKVGIAWWVQTATQLQAPAPLRRPYWHFEGYMLRTVTPNLLQMLPGAGPWDMCLPQHLDVF